MNDVKYLEQWNNKFNELCHAVFYKDERGAALLKMLEDRYFRSPVAFPNQEPSWAYFNEGKNEMIRMFTAAIQAHMNPPQPSVNNKPLKKGGK